jgi:SSS family solute:Na+ symporter
MTTLDWVIIALYAGGLVLLGWWLGRRQTTSEDYYLAGRRLGWFPIGVSTMATQLGAVSFLSAPAFVGLRPGGGLIWLGYELAVPLAMIVLMAVLFPVFHSMRVVSVYEVLEHRFDVRVRVLVSLVFQVSRGLATGVTVYAAAIVVSVTTGIPLWTTILLIGFVAMLYELLGGIHVDIVSDTIQMIILFAGILLVGAVALDAVGGWSVVRGTLASDRFLAVDFGAHGLGDSKDFGFWPLLIGGFFLYLSYYGSDQSQVQRELSTRSLDACKGSLLFNGLARFPVVLAYCTVGLILGAWVALNPDFLQKMPGGNVDYMVPVFIRDNLAPGLTGFVFVAIMAAAMSSLDSAINSLSAATLEDVYKKLSRQTLSARDEMRLSKLLTLLWGAVCIGFAFQVGNIAPTILESINKIGSAFYGPVFAVFLLGLVSRRVRPTGAVVGLIVGVTLNLGLWIFVPSVSWLWWNAFGFLLTATVMLLLGNGSGTFREMPEKNRILERSVEKPIWKRMYLLLGIYAAGILLLLTLMPAILG